MTDGGLRILILHSFYSSASPSGENNVVLDQVEALQSAGHEVQLISRSTDDLEDQTFYKARASLRVATGRGSGAGREVREFGPDIVHVHNLFPNFGTQWLIRLRLPVVVTVHNQRFGCANGINFRNGAQCYDCNSLPVLPAVAHGCYRSPLATIPVALSTAPNIGTSARLLRRADAIIALNRQVEDELSYRLGRRDIQIVPNFGPSARDVTKAPSGPRASTLFVGRLTEEKGIRQLLQFWPSGQPLDVVGDGPLSSLVQRSAEGRAEITFHGRLDKSSVQRLIAGAARVIVPSLWAEGFPTVALEAFSCGRPVLISDKVAAAESISAAGLGGTFDPLSEASLLAGLRKMMTSAALPRASVIASKYEHVFGRQAWLRNIDDVYKRAIYQRNDRSDRSQ